MQCIALGRRPGSVDNFALDSLVLKAHSEPVIKTPRDPTANRTAGPNIGGSPHATPYTSSMGPPADEGKLMHVLSMERRVAVVEHLTDGAGVRAASRLTRTHKTTILSLLLKLGAGCARLHNRHVRGLSVGRVECDEMHSFIHTREKNLRGDEPPEWGESWLWTAVASTAKLIISYRVAPTRGEEHAEHLVRDLRGRVVTCPTINTDGLDSYVGPVKRWFGGAGVDYAQVVKNFQGRGRKDYDRYAPPTAPMVTKRPVFGVPDMDEASTSFVERTNLSVRTCLRRFVRRGTGHSKSLAHHEAMVAVFVAWFNFCRIHETLRCTPAMQAGLADHVWSVEELVDAALSAEPCEPPEPRPLAPRPDAPKVTTKTTPTGVRLRAVDGGKAPRREVTLGAVLEEARRREGRGEPPPDTPGGGGSRGGAA
jgi:IS1 family transposase